MQAAIIEQWEILQHETVTSPQAVAQEVMHFMCVVCLE